MIWSDHDIAEAHKDGLIRIDPFNDQAIQPASYDLTLGDIFYWFKRTGVIDPRMPVAPLMERGRRQEVFLAPGAFMLGMTREKVSLGDNVVARVEGKSSLGRLGLTVHSTAGFIDPGNQNLNITLEIYNQSPLPIILYAGMWICQLSFELTRTPAVRPYGPGRGSRYFGDSEPVPSRIDQKV